MKELIVNEKYNGKKLNTFLLDMFPALKQGTIYKALRKKDIRINGKRIHENTTIYTNDQIQLFITDELLENTSPFSLSIIYEDDFILLIDKPVGIEVVGSQSLTSYLHSYAMKRGFGFIEPCHRIDRNTTGLVLFAKTEESLSILLQKFKDHEIEKHYLAKVYGILPKKQARLQAYLFKDQKKSLVYISDTPQKGYQKIVTSYQVLKESKQQNTSLLDITLETGRTHQIRAHLAHIGFPIIGDR